VHAKEEVGQCSFWHTRCDKKLDAGVECTVETPRLMIKQHSSQWKKGLTEKSTKSLSLVSESGGFPTFLEFQSEFQPKVNCLY